MSKEYLDAQCKNPQRDLMITLDAQKMPVKQVAEKYGLSTTRIYCIVEASHHKSDDPLWWQLISRRMRNAIINEGYGPNDLHEIRFLGKAYWLQCPHIGPKSIAEFEEATGEWPD